MYVGNLAFSTTEDDLRELFSQYGTVSEVFLPTDRDTGRPRGFAFISMDTAEAMHAAIEGQNGKEFLGRALTINEARPREERPSYGGGGGGGGARRGGGGGYGGYGGGGGGYGGGGGRDRGRDRDRGNKYQDRY